MLGAAWQSDQMALMLPVHVGATTAAAREAMRPGVHKYYKNLQAIFSRLPASYGDHLQRLRTIDENVANLPFEKFCRDTMAPAYEKAAELTRSRR